MGSSSSIEWTEATWNPTRGCTRISPGCQHCYAERFAHRLSGPGLPYEGLTRSTPNGPRWRGIIRPIEDAVDLPLHWRKPRRIFVNSMSDLFHEDLDVGFLRRVFDVMRRASWHTYQILTKRGSRLRAIASELEWAPNIWMGVSVEDASHGDRIDDLRTVPAAVSFLSLEPLLGPLPNLNLDGIHWVIVGGESGPGARLMNADWVREIRDQCVHAEVSFFFKQWGGVRKGKTGRELDGRTWDEFPLLRSAPADGDHGDDTSVEKRLGAAPQATVTGA
jgi:protein gp37